ncbi:glycerophosphodiester phosphodiesterase [Synechococcales cyanobacterium C]|uniref:Glycerophosphodiester phosphodiesterase n=1 Tax=Petrachloros mirabilis ULC683 TaxID=2781853 RepID=A0A8K2A1Z5_9CYAN|nr:glycerophosphodiester phosphodiesterase [Petrachloros mirabilis]NCJ08352.1 glycerophosphodiester phosphodiesterase [Petrachloros mirabilis ULC683]
MLSLVAYPPIMLILSHRGFYAHCPENTLAAFEAAIALGVDGIETDIRLSQDHRLILFHDRLAPNGQDVATLTQRELSQQVGYPVPALAEVLQLPLLNPTAFLWNLELKTPDTLPLTLEVLRQYQTTRRLLVTSFWHPLISAVSQDIQVEGGLLIAHRPLKVSRQTPWPWLANHPKIRTIVYRYETLDADLVTQTQACGLQVFVYGAITPSDHQQLVQWSVEGIITNHPDAL